MRIIPVDKKPTSPMTTSKIVKLSLKVISLNDDRGTEDCRNHLALVKDQGRFDACILDGDVVPHIQEYLHTHQDLREDGS